MLVRLLLATVLSALAPFAAAIGPDGPASLPTFPAAARPAHLAYEQALRAVPSADSLQHWHELLASEPHIAGTDGDLRTADRIAEVFAGMGLEVEKHEVWAYLCRPVAATLEIVSPEPIALGIKEAPLEQDRYSANPDLHPGWNAYSGSGDVTAPIVYANYGTKADFARLKDLGIDLAGKIVIARYGSNYRGYKAKFAQAAGAAGLIIYTDPADSGYCKGIMYPEGGYANDTCIQRGSLNTLDWDGDPLTPFEPATKDAKRLDPETIDLPRIPVQPIGWGAAKEILSRMTGPAVPEGWQGGLPLAYRLTGGDALTVRLKVEQERFIAKTYNVIGTLRGSSNPDQLVLVGAHHDAWGYGACDPLCGTITVLESARAFTQSLGIGRPRRSIAFCAWAAEEYGLIGSVEWVEANRDRLFKNAVAYINLDMASMGPDFGAACSPSLRRVITDAARSVPQPASAGKPSSAPTPPTAPAPATVFDAWLARGEDPLAPGTPRTGDIGGGSDHVGFNCHLAISVAGMGGSGAKGTSYHSVYDNLVWYWKIVGADYAPALMVTRMTTTILARLADSPLLPLDPVRPATDTLSWLAAISKDGEANGFFPKPPPPPARPDAAAAAEAKPADARSITPDLASIAAAATRYRDLAQRTHTTLLAALDRGDLSDAHLAQLNTLLLQLDRDWHTNEGLPARPWFRSLLTATDEDSGYASWTLPALRRAVERRDREELTTAVNLYLAVFDRLTHTMEQIEHLTTSPHDQPTGR